MKKLIVAMFVCVLMGQVAATTAHAYSKASYDYGGWKHYKKHHYKHWRKYHRHKHYHHHHYHYYEPYGVSRVRYVPQQYCREYMTTVRIGGRKVRGYSTACRQPGGVWRIVHR